MPSMSVWVVFCFCLAQWLILWREKPWSKPSEQHACPGRGVPKQRLPLLQRRWERQEEAWRLPCQGMEKQQGELSRGLASDFPLEKRDVSRELVGMISSQEAGVRNKAGKAGCDRSQCEPQHSCGSCSCFCQWLFGDPDGKGESLPPPCLCEPGKLQCEVWPFVNTGLKVSPTLESLKTRKMHYKSTISRRKIFLWVFMEWFLSPVQLDQCRLCPHTSYFWLAHVRHTPCPQNGASALHTCTPAPIPFALPIFLQLCTRR